MSVCRDCIGHIAVTALCAGVTCAAFFGAGGLDLFGLIAVAAGSGESVIVLAVVADGASFTAVAFFTAVCFLHFENKAVAVCVNGSGFCFAAADAGTCLCAVLGAGCCLEVGPVTVLMSDGSGELVEECRTATTAVVDGIAVFIAGRFNDAVNIRAVMLGNGYFGNVGSGVIIDASDDCDDLLADEFIGNSECGAFGVCYFFAVAVPRDFVVTE